MSYKGLSSREFAIKELQHHQNQSHLIEFDERGGFVCLTCKIGCVGTDVGDLRVINGSKYPTAPEYTFPKD